MSDLSKIALGTVQFGLDYGISNNIGKPNQHIVNKILDFALNKDVKTLDTASAYGNSETILGNYGVEEFNVISKFIPKEVDKGLEKSLNDSLCRLRIKHLYGYLAHRADSINDKSWGELIKLKAEGKVQKIGYSLQSLKEFDRLKSKGFLPDLIQVPFNILDNRFKDLCIDLHSQGVEIHTRSSFLQGLFFLKSEQLEVFKEIKKIVLELQVKYKKDLAQYLLNYVLKQDFIDKVVIGVQSIEQLNQNLDAFKIKNGIESFDIPISENILNPALWTKV